MKEFTAGQKVVIVATLEESQEEEYPLLIKKEGLFVTFTKSGQRYNHYDPILQDYDEFVNSLKEKDSSLPENKPKGWLISINHLHMNTFEMLQQYSKHFNMSLPTYESLKNSLHNHYFGIDENGIPLSIRDIDARVDDYKILKSNEELYSKLSEFIDNQPKSDKKEIVDILIEHELKLLTQLVEFYLTNKISIPLDIIERINSLNNLLNND